MTKYVFTATHHDDSKVTVEFEADTISKVLENFEYFLSGAGFYNKGYLDFVTDEEDSSVETINLDISSFNKTYEDYIDLSKCPICKLTDEQLGPHICYDKNCPKMEKQI